MDDQQTEQHDLPFVDSYNIRVRDEEITMVLYSGTKAHFYGFAPKHFAAFKELVDQKFDEYEKDYGKITQALRG
ncbi:MAG: hypothetical protein ACM3KM_02580 [Acidobacteriaceae bacterium]